MRTRLQLKRTLLLLGLHLVVLSPCYVLAFALRFDFSVSGDMWALLWLTLPWVMAVKLVAFSSGRGFHGWLRCVAFADLVHVLKSGTLATLAIAGIDYFLVADRQIPRAVLLLDWGITILAIGGLRSACRLFREHLWIALHENGKSRALLVGVDRGGEAMTRLIHGDPKLDFRVVGFLDQNAARRGSCLGGIPFLGRPQDAVQVAKRHRADDILIISNSISGEQLRDLNEQCNQAKIPIKMIPPVEHFLNGTSRLQVRDIDIGDLLRRDPVLLDSQVIAEMVSSKRVMITGAGGSIGSEICRQLVTFGPERLILVERAENSLFAIEQELGHLSSDLILDARIADVCDKVRVRVLFERYQPQLVFHAAAHKHVPLMEYNPGEAIKNNVFGTKDLADIAHEYGVERFVFISTDKAVNPTSVMGISKELAERYVQALATESATQFLVVRFGNVLGSTGSVVPVFQEQIRRGGPITVTHPEMRRFFMTIPEASQLVLQAAALGDGGEVFVLDMGEPIRIVDLAHDLIRLSGFKTEEVKTVIVGSRPGEKLYEELFSDQEQTMPTSHPKLRVSRPNACSKANVQQWMVALAPLVDGAEEDLREMLARLYDERRDPIARKRHATANWEAGRATASSHFRGNGNGLPQTSGNRNSRSATGVVQVE